MKEKMAERQKKGDLNMGRPQQYRLKTIFFAEFSNPLLYHLKHISLP